MVEAFQIQLDISEILEFIEIAVFLMKHVPCKPTGVMEWWNSGMVILKNSFFFFIIK